MQADAHTIFERVATVAMSAHTFIHLVRSTWACAVHAPGHGTAGAHSRRSASGLSFTTPCYLNPVLLWERCLLEHKHLSTHNLCGRHHVWCAYLLTCLFQRCANVPKAASQKCYHFHSCNSSATCRPGMPPESCPTSRHRSGCNPPHKPVNTPRERGWLPLFMPMKHKW